VALVTGASSGLGLCLSEQLVAKGYRVAMLAQGREPLEEAARRVGAGGGTTRALVCDVREADRVRSAVSEVEADWGRIDVAIANAGLGRATWATDFDLEAAELMVRTNYLGVVHLYAAVIPGMLARGGGHFAGVASLAGLRCLPGGSAYAASKAAVQAFLDTVRPELGPRGVRVTTVNPWFVSTPHNAGTRRPFMVEPDWAAGVILRGVERGARTVEFPWPAALGMRLLRLAPDAWFDWWVGRRYRATPR